MDLAFDPMFRPDGHDNFSSMRFFGYTPYSAPPFGSRFPSPLINADTMDDSRQRDEETARRC